MKENQLSGCRQVDGGVSSGVSIWTPCCAPAEARRIRFSQPLNVERLRSTRRVMGLFEASHCETVDVELAPGDTLLLYTDGITEVAGRGRVWRVLPAGHSCEPCSPAGPDPFSKQWPGQSSNSAALANNRMTSPAVGKSRSVLNPATVAT